MWYSCCYDDDCDDDCDDDFVDDSEQLLVLSMDGIVGGATVL